MRYPILALISFGNRPRNCVSPLRDFEVKIDRFQIKQNVLDLKSLLYPLILSTKYFVFRETKLIFILGFFFQYFFM